jgi:hypothetical protein
MRGGTVGELTAKARRLMLCRLTGSDMILSITLCTFSNSFSPNGSFPPPSMTSVMASTSFSTLVWSS